MRNLLALSVAAFNIAACWSLQLVSFPQHQFFQRSFSARSQDHSPLDNTIVIQSKAYNISDGNISTTGATPLRRTIHVQKEENSEENFTEPKIPQYAIDCGEDKACLEAHGLDSPEATFKPYTQEELERLLSQYSASHGKSPVEGNDSAANKLATLYMDDEDAVINVLESNTNTKDQEKSKSATWHLLQSQKHNQPQEGEKGWVTLEPVPWAHSQIQKWEPNAKPQIPTWDNPGPQRPSDPWGYRPSTERPWGKPTYEYKPSRPQYSQWTRPGELPAESTSLWSQDIITDNQPGYFPGPQQPQEHNQRPWYDQQPYGSNRPPQTYKDRPLHQEGGYHGHQPTHLKEGEGQWVLLSSTKGYSIPHRHRGTFQRAISFDSKASSSKAPTVSASLSSHRTVRLTVLPADNSTNTTLSHGGLLEVESTLQTVEEAQREHAAKMLRLTTPKPADSVKSPTNSRRSGEAVQVFSASPADGQGKTAMLAAIGAGMIPATMAMLLPMVLGRRRRRSADSVNNTRLDTVLKLHRVVDTFHQARSNKEASY